MKIIQIPLLKDNYGYFLICEKTKEAAIVDPSEAEPFGNALRRDVPKLDRHAEPASPLAAPPIQECARRPRPDEIRVTPRAVQDLQIDDAAGGRCGRFVLRYRDAEEPLAERGIAVADGTGR